ncbi:CBS domain protein [Idiomarina fontislapidosi]|uniref:CBS domain-containing protein n=1 Tax=Idiomarina fontislapidosi TaxID=263723 RepID=A0A432XV92_9GAMM|nr:CBS domain-containing protein [Idiomarina fontislapidosi]PYE31800.1 CBS domain protein [Idiomarina fontislapidosi]RUO52524.1 hypothetical protein CWE25_09355 [Idiomarina fontislapidosi]|tara:strand:+ start:1986 stop:2573 length:588 start_codon:yes stop_codon:yes gene_type:complete
MTEFKSLKSVSHGDAVTLSSQARDPFVCDWHANALHVFDDFERHDPLLLRATTSLDRAEQLMHSAKVRYACVVNNNEQIIGLVALREFHSRHAMQVSQSTQLPWAELTVGDLMRKLDELPQAEYKQLQKARIGDAAATLKSAGRDFLLVFESGSIRGVVSSLRIAQVTGESVNIYHSASTFAEIISAVNHSHLND